MKNVRVKVRNNCTGNWWEAGIFKGNREILATGFYYDRKQGAQRRAKSIAKQTGVKYDPEIIKLHDC